MEPTLQAGDRVLCVPWWRYQPGQVVVANGPDGPMVKRITQHGDRGFWLLGDNKAQSTDSRELGWFTRDQLRGRMVYRYAPTERVGWLWSV